MALDPRRNTGLLSVIWGMIRDTTTPRQVSVDGDGNVHTDMVDRVERVLGEAAIRNIDESGVAYGIKHIGNKPRVSSMPYLYDIAEGNVSDHERFGAFAERAAVVVAGADIWGGVANTIPRPVDAGEQLEIISTSANDDGAPVGTGIRTVGIHYLDATGAAQDEIVTLNGLAPVALAESNVRFVNELHAVTVGAAGVAAGNITLYKQGTPATVYSRIALGQNVGLNSSKMIPLNKQFYLTQWGCTSAGGKNTAVRLRITSRHGVLYPGVFMTRDSAFLIDAVYVRSFDVPIKIPALSILKVFADPVLAGAYVSASWGGWLECC